MGRIGCGERRGYRILQPLAKVTSTKSCVGFLSLLLLLTIPLPERCLIAADQTQAGAGLSKQTAEAAPAERIVRAYTLPPDKYEQAVRYARATTRLYFTDFIWSGIVLLLVLLWRLGPRYRDWATRTTRRRFLQAAVYTPLLLGTLAILGLPPGLYGHWLSRHYGLSIQGWGSWAWDWAKMQLLEFGLGIFLVWILYGILRRSVRRWWLYFWLAALPIIVFVVFISPLVVEPMFFEYQPLAAHDPGLVAAIERVTTRAGIEIPSDRMYLMVASRKLRSLNAYVSGFGASKRVVVWDTTIEKMTTPQVLSVFGHEMGHYVLHHIPKEMALDVLVLLAFFYLTHRGFGWMLGRWGRRWAIDGAEDWASLPALLLLVTVLGFLATPVIDGISRHFEHQADIYGLEVIHGIVPDSQQVTAQAFQIFGEVDLSDPHPSRFIVFWLYTHPPIGDRLRFALEYDPWAKGGSPRYVH